MFRIRDVTYDCGDEDIPAHNSFINRIKRRCNERHKCNFKALPRDVQAQSCPSKLFFSKICSVYRYSLDSFTLTLSYACMYGGRDNSKVRPAVPGTCSGGGWQRPPSNNPNPNRDPWGRQPSTPASNKCDQSSQVKQMDVKCGDRVTLKCSNGCLR